MEELVQSFEVSTPTKIRFVTMLLTNKKDTLVNEQDSQIQGDDNPYSDELKAEESKESDSVVLSAKVSNKKRKFNDESKLQIVMKAIHTGNNSLVARQERIDESTIRKWKSGLKDDPKIKETQKDQRKKDFHAWWADMEKELNTWIDSQREKKVSVSMRDIITEAQRIMKIMHPSEDFSGL